MSYSEKESESDRETEGGREREMKRWEKEGGREVDLSILALAHLRPNILPTELQTYLLSGGSVLVYSRNKRIIINLLGGGDGAADGIHSQGLANIET